MLCPSLLLSLPNSNVAAAGVPLPLWQGRMQPGVVRGAVPTRELRHFFVPLYFKVCMCPFLLSYSGVESTATTTETAQAATVATAVATVPEGLETS